MRNIWVNILHDMLSVSVRLLPPQRNIVVIDTFLCPPGSSYTVALWSQPCQGLKDLNFKIFQFYENMFTGLHSLHQTRPNKFITVKYCNQVRKRRHKVGPQLRSLICCYISSLPWLVVGEEVWSITAHTGDNCAATREHERCSSVAKTEMGIQRI